jgi:prevent-host-death family protein
MVNYVYLEKMTKLWSGLTRQTMGKTQARKQFLPLVDQLADNRTVIEITDHDVPVAVLISYEQFLMLKSKIATLTPSSVERIPSLIGSGRILTDDLEAASAEITELLLDSIEESARRL